MSEDLNAFPEYPLCSFCKDAGLVFGGDQPFRFCGCEAGQHRREKEPALLDDLNAQRSGLGIGTPPSAGIAAHKVDE